MEFKRTIRKLGKDSYCISIPKALVTANQLELNKEYRFEVFIE
jgi:hypothetical protein